MRQAGATPLRAADPARIGPYLSLGLLGSGGMGRVYLSRRADGQPGLAAVKVIRPELAEDAEFRRRFDREATVHARVGAPYTPELWGTGFESENDQLWMATEYVPGLNLSDAVKECGVLAPAGAWRLVEDLGRALTALADSGIVHRDFKPSNVILSARGAHVIDFGIAQAADASAITMTGSRVGTPAFMSPEYLRDGRCDTASDVFSFASTLVYAVTGHAPFGDGTGVDVLHRVASEEPRAEIMAEVAETDEALSALLRACLSKDPAVRPTPQDLVATAGAQARAGSWQEPLNSRLRARGQAYETLRHATVPQPAPVSPTPTERVTYSPGTPGFGPPMPPPEPTGTPTRSIRSRRRYAVLAAALAVAATAATAFALTRPDTTQTASATGTPTTASASGTYDDSHNAGLPDLTDSPSASTSHKTKSPSPRTDDETTSPTAPPSKAPGSHPETTPPASPTATTKPTTPAQPPWLTQCTYYSGTELTELGDKGQRVVQVQCMLTKRGYSVGSAGVDGDFGKNTDAAVRSFQSAKGLVVDGQVGVKTWAALRSST